MTVVVRGSNYKLADLPQEIEGDEIATAGGMSLGDNGLAPAGLIASCRELTALSEVGSLLEMIPRLAAGCFDARGAELFDLADEKTATLVAGHGVEPAEAVARKQRSRVSPAPEPADSLEPVASISI